jgi:hypothetical protein
VDEREENAERKSEGMKCKSKEKSQGSLNTDSTWLSTGYPV